MKRLITLLLICVVLAGCSSTGFLMGKAKVTMFGNVTYPSKDENVIIEVFRTNIPPYEYVEIAQIICRDTNDKWCLEQISKKAREIGADAIIIVGKAGSSGVGIPIGFSTYVVSEEYGMTAIAIRYR